MYFILISCEGQSHKAACLTTLENKGRAEVGESNLATSARLPRRAPPPLPLDHTDSRSSSADSIFKHRGLPSPHYRFVATKLQHGLWLQRSSCTTHVSCTMFGYTTGSPPQIALRQGHSPWLRPALTPSQNQSTGLRHY